MSAEAGTGEFRTGPLSCRCKARAMCRPLLKWNSFTFSKSWGVGVARTAISSSVCGNQEFLARCLTLSPEVSKPFYRLLFWPSSSSVLFLVCSKARFACLWLKSHFILNGGKDREKEEEREGAEEGEREKVSFIKGKMNLNFWNDNIWSNIFHSFKTLLKYNYISCPSLSSLLPFSCLIQPLPNPLPSPL